MKITIDTENKLIHLKGTTNIEEFIEGIKKFLPDEWKEYSLSEYSPFSSIGTTLTTPGTLNDWVQPNTYEPPYYTTCNSDESNN